MTSTKQPLFKLFLLLPLCALLFWGCPPGTDDPPDPELASLSSTLKQFFAFPEGSYWIYEDSLSSEVDSTSYTNYLLDEDAGHHFGNCVLERIRVQYYRSYYGSTLNGGTETFCDVDDESFFFNAQTVFFRGLTPSAADPEVMVEIGPGAEGAGVAYEALHDAITIRGVEYNNVRQFRIDLSVGAAGFARIYLAPGIGIVKNETEDGRIWELVRYQLN